jgi:HPt (histidine-containing phosphotransfer) domain-containing protein
VTDPPVIDPAAFDALSETTGGDPEFLAELIDTFLTDGVDLLATLDAALAAGDAVALRRAAHSLKSNGATFGATALSALAQRLEELGKATELAGAGTLIAQARQEFGRVERSLSATRAAL